MRFMSWAKALVVYGDGGLEAEIMAWAVERLGRFMLEFIARAVVSLYDDPL